jgi:DNA-binding transcriptional MerR regulator
MSLSASGLYSISSVSNLTGVNSVTLRAWERRYGLVVPTRTEAGHRLYTQEDVDRIKLILQLLDEGIAISRVKEALRIAAEREAPPEPEDQGFWQQLQRDMLAAVADFDEKTLERIYNESMSLYPVEVVTRQLLLPLLGILGKRWMKSETGIAEEHFFSVFMRNKLGARFHHRNMQVTGPVVVAACLPGEQHEFGLLLFALAANARGYRIILLGSDMPLAPIPHVAKRTACQAIVLSGSVEMVPQAIQQQLITLREKTGLPVLVGGLSSSRYRDEVEAAGAIVVGDDLIVGLHTLNKLLPIS